jgi:hypothetical protein
VKAPAVTATESKEPEEPALDRPISPDEQRGFTAPKDWLKNEPEKDFTNGRKCGFTYILEFGQGPVHVSPAGFEVGAIVGKDFQLLSH